MKTFTIICIFVFISCGNNQVSNSVESFTNESYRIHVNKSDNLFSIEAKLIIEDNKLNMSSKFDFLKISQFVRNLEAKDLEGNSISIEKRTDHWLISSKSGKHVILTYDIVFDHDDVSWSAGIDVSVTSYVL